MHDEGEPCTFEPLLRELRWSARSVKTYCRHQPASSPPIVKGSFTPNSRVRSSKFRVLPILNPYCDRIT